jgi:hypothetical protein
VPDVPATAEPGVYGVLSRREDKCLVRAHVRQQWHAAHGDRRDLIIGAKNQPHFHAHAWLEGDSPAAQQGFDELMRQPAP